MTIIEAILSGFDDDVDWVKAGQFMRKQIMADLRNLEKYDDWADKASYAIWREWYEAPCKFSSETIAEALRKARSDTLEEAAKCAELYNKDGPDRVSTIARQINIATAIRNLNTVGDLGRKNGTEG